MIAKPAFAAALLLAPVPAIPATVDLATTETDIGPWKRPEVVRVLCEERAGTAFYVGPTTLISVAHVTERGEGCRINGKPFTVVRQEGDFTILTGERSDKWLTVDCDGFVKGRKYVAWGYARGLYHLTTVDTVATGGLFFGFYRLWGVFNVIPGQSGGPFIDSVTGKVPGAINVYNAQRGDSGSTELRKTSVCAA